MAKTQIQTQSFCTHNQSGNSPIAWLGGKSRLTKQLIGLIPPHETYVEVFAGGAWLLFRKSKSRAEIINDINNDLVNFYRILKLHPEAFALELKNVLCSRHEFKRQQEVSPNTLTDIQRAARFYYLNRTAFGAHIVGQTYPLAVKHRPAFGSPLRDARLAAASERLRQVSIECLPWTDMLIRADRVDTFFYLDPPYFGVEDYYGKHIFSRSDYQKMADILANIQGKFMLSINDTKEIREIFNRFKMDIVPTIYSTGRHEINKVNELVITNY